MLFWYVHTFLIFGELIMAPDADDVLVIIAFVGSQLSFFFAVDVCVCFSSKFYKLHKCCSLNSGKVGDFSGKWMASNKQIEKLLRFTVSTEHHVVHTDTIHDHLFMIELLWMVVLFNANAAYQFNNALWIHFNSILKN